MINFYFYMVKGPQNAQRWLEYAFTSQTCKILKLAYYRHYCIDAIQILHSAKDHQMPFVGDPNTHVRNPRWRTAAILKNLKIAISQQQFHWSGENLACWRMLTILTRLTIKILNFKNPIWRTAAILKNRKILSAMVQPIWTKFGTLTQVDHLGQPLKFRIF